MKTWNPGLVAACALPVLICSCRAEDQSDKPGSTASIVEVEPPSSTVALASAVSPAMPRYRVFHVFPKGTQIWALGTRLIACKESLSLGEVADRFTKTWLISAKHVEEDASLLPQGRTVSLARGLYYWGRYPDDVLAVFIADYDENTTHVAFRYLGHGAGSRFVPAECGLACAYSEGQAFPRSKPRCLDPWCAPFDRYIAEELAAWRLRRPGQAGPGSPSAMLFGFGGPMLVLDYKKMARWDGTAWQRSATPWAGRADGARLANGTSLAVASEGYQRSIFWIDLAGQPQAIDLASPARERGLFNVRFVKPVERDNEVWLVGETDASTVLFAPVDGADAKRPPYAYNEVDGPF